MTEAELQAAAIQYLTASGWLVTRVHAGYFRGRRSVREGTADLVCCARGRYVEIEVKSDEGELRPAQVKRMRDVVANGGEYFVVRSMAMVRDVVRWMEKKDESTHRPATAMP